MNHYELHETPYQYKCPYVDEYGELIMHNYAEPADAIWEIVCNLFNSNVLSEDDLRSDMAYLCSYYGLDDTLLYADQCSLVGDIDVHGPLNMEWFSDCRDAVRSLRDKLYHRNMACTREDLRGTLAYLCIHLGIETDYLEHQETA